MCNASPIQVLNEKKRFAKDASSRRIAEVPEKANEQHYCVPPSFFNLVLGEWSKYSCCLFAKNLNDIGNQGIDKLMDLTEGEEKMLELYCVRSKIQNGMSLLDVGCGWGSLSLYIAQKYPDCAITAVSNSSEQKKWILTQIDTLGIDNVHIITCDVADLKNNHLGDLESQFDVIMSIEMFEHCKNWTNLLADLKLFLKPTGHLFIQVFCHKLLPYHFDDNSWMSRTFFSGGIMPCTDLITYSNVIVKDRWLINGCHYAQTSKLWLNNLDKHQKEILAIFEKKWGTKAAHTQLNRWRMFFIAVEETFKYNKGEEWMVAHYLLK